jgi:hypothetical protein
MPSVDLGIAQQILRAIEPARPEPVPEGFRIHVHAAVSRFAVLYERIRNAVDYKDEHLLRKAAIIRILKRQFILERHPEAIAQQLVRELIGARYLPNNELHESLVADVALRIEKFQAIERCCIGSQRHIAWLRNVLAVEIEERLVDGTREKVLTTFLYERLADRIQFRGTAMDETDVRLQVYIAVCRTLIKADDETLSFKLLRAYVPEWLRPADWVENPVPMAERLIGVESRIRSSLTHPNGPRIQRAVKPWAVSLNVLKEALLEKPDEAKQLFEKPEVLQASVAKVADRQYRHSKARLRRGAVRAIIYIFLTKMLIAIALEIPLEQLIYHAISVPILVINLLFPPVLMCIVALFIRVPGKENTARLQANTLALLSREGIPMRELRIPPKRGFVAKTLFSTAYAVVYLLIFGMIGMVLLQLQFTGVSAAIFLFFLCTVSFFAFRLRQNAREYVIIEGKDSLRSLFLDVISLPILRAGHLLAQGISRLNVFLFFLDFLLEAPFKIFLTVLEEWFAFLKEKKEELQ